MYFWGDKWIMNCWIEKNRRQLKILAKLLINNVVECMNAWHNDDYKQMCIDDQIQNSHIWWSRWFRFRLIHLDSTTQSKSMWRGSLKICLDNKSNDIKILFFLFFPCASKKIRTNARQSHYTTMSDRFVHKYFQYYEYWVLCFAFNKFICMHIYIVVECVCVLCLF